MHDDDPDDVVHNLFASQAWGDSAAGPADRGHRRVDRGAEPRPDRPVLPQPLPAADHGGRGRRQRRPRRPSSARCAPRSAATASSPAPTLPVRAVVTDRGPPGHRRRRRTPTRPLEQVNLVLGVKGLTRSDPRRFALGVLNTALGGGTSSRLFQEVRERARPGLLRLLVRQPLRRRRRRRASRSAACRPSSTRCWPSCARSCARWPPTASPTRSWSAARACCAAAWCSAWRTPARGCRGSARPSSSTTSCSASTRCWPRVDAVTVDDVRDPRGGAVRPAADAGGRRSRGPGTSAQLRSSAMLLPPSTTRHCPVT